MAFKRRQEQDVKRRRMLMAELEEQDDFGENSDYEEDPSVDKGWSNTDGDRLGDFGVDEDAYDVVDADESDDNVPLGELLRRRNVVVKDSQE
jgi:palmitoyltransferase